MRLHAKFGGKSADFARFMNMQQYYAEGWRWNASLRVSLLQYATARTIVSDNQFVVFNCDRKATCHKVVVELREHSLPNVHRQADSAVPFYLPSGGPRHGQQVRRYEQRPSRSGGRIRRLSTGIYTLRKLALCISIYPPTHDSRIPPQHTTSIPSFSFSYSNKPIIWTAIKKAASNGTIYSLKLDESDSKSLLAATPSLFQPVRWLRFAVKNKKTREYDRSAVEPRENACAIPDRGSRVVSHDAGHSAAHKKSRASLKSISSLNEAIDSLRPLKTSSPLAKSDIEEAEVDRSYHLQRVQINTDNMVQELLTSTLVFSREEALAMRSAIPACPSSESVLDIEEEIEESIALLGFENEEFMDDECRAVAFFKPARPGTPYPRIILPDEDNNEDIPEQMPSLIDDTSDGSESSGSPTEDFASSPLDTAVFNNDSDFCISSVADDDFGCLSGF
ncbi:hypothetical protein NM688_g300 [Phlebia brevispora]|uniref:Uncharacterized protein n=1 Tax=Phlebia brevispora TaxID=194682 RepID=A0ACC1TEY1_9APHY|nr:hypothetical protein NM688_g300 [Phlebia brevispora]